MPRGKDQLNHLENGCNLPIAVIGFIRKTDCSQGRHRGVYAGLVVAGDARDQVAYLELLPLACAPGYLLGIGWCSDSSGYTSRRLSYRNPSETLHKTSKSLDNRGCQTSPKIRGRFCIPYAAGAVPRMKRNSWELNAWTETRAVSRRHAFDGVRRQAWLTGYRYWLAINQPKDLYVPRRGTDAHSLAKPARLLSSREHRCRA